MGSRRTSATTRAQVAVIGTGGTISTVGRDALDVFEAGAFGRVLEVEQVVDEIAGLVSVVDLLPVRLCALPSPSITVQHWLDLNRLIHTVRQDHKALAGIVVTHGTANLEETAYFLHLVSKVDVPIVVVGSQRPLSALSSDAPVNLLRAIHVAAHPQSRGLGVLVVMNEQIHSAREATKTSTYRLEGFRSPEVGMLGFADPDGDVKYYRRPTRRHAPRAAFEVRALQTLPRVDVAYSYTAADGAAIEAFVAHGAEGIISAGMPPGVVPPDEWRALVAARESGIVVVQSSRAGSGRVLQSQRMTQHGIVAADDLNPQKARVLTTLALTVTHSATAIQRMFARY